MGENMWSTGARGLSPLVIALVACVMILNSVDAIGLPSESAVHQLGDDVSQVKTAPLVRMPTHESKASDNSVVSQIQSVLGETRRIPRFSFKKKKGRKRKLVRMPTQQLKIRERNVKSKLKVVTG